MNRKWITVQSIDDLPFLSISKYGKGWQSSEALFTEIHFPPFQRLLCVLRAVPHHCARHGFEPERVSGVHICGDDGAVGLRAVVGCACQRHHRHDPGQHVRRHVAVEHQPQRCVPGEPGHGEKQPETHLHIWNTGIIFQTLLLANHNW